MTVIKDKGNMWLTDLCQFGVGYFGKSRTPARPMQINIQCGYRLKIWLIMYTNIVTVLKDHKLINGKAYTVGESITQQIFGYLSQEKLCQIYLFNLPSPG